MMSKDKGNIGKELILQFKNRKEYDLKVVGANLKRLREQKGYSVADVRDYLQLGSVQAVYKYESGKNFPQADTLLALMELYDATIEDIVGAQTLTVDRIVTQLEAHGKMSCIVDDKIIEMENRIARVKVLKRYADFFGHLGERGAAS